MISCLVMSGLYQGFIHVGTAVAEKLPGLADLGNHFKIEIGGEDFVFIAAGLGEDSTARVAEVALSVELANVPGRLGADAVDGTDEISIGYGVRGLFEFPQVFTQSGNGSGR